MFSTIYYNDLSFLHTKDISLSSMRKLKLRINKYLHNDRTWTNFKKKIIANI